MPENAAEAFIFTRYCALYGTRGFDTPALIPQVYLHYDPYTRRASMPLTRQRMDFLLLLPHRRRVDIELDGVHHYADDQQRADPGAMRRWSPRTGHCSWRAMRSTGSAATSSPADSKPPECSTTSSPASSRRLTQPDENARLLRCLGIGIAPEHEVYIYSGFRAVPKRWRPLSR